MGYGWVVWVFLMFHQGFFLVHEMGQSMEEMGRGWWVGSGLFLDR